MEELYRIENAWYVKIIFAVITTLFAPFKVSLYVLCTMILIDTLTGCIYAIKTKRLNSRGFRRGLNKILMYSLCILVVRLLEVGIAPIFNTTNLTNFISGYLILTECLSALENLQLLGAPLPTKIKKIILGNIKNSALSKIFHESESYKNYNDEISDIIQYCIPNLKDEKAKKLMEIKLVEWSKFIDILDKELEKAEDYSNDLILCKILSLLEATSKKTSECWIDEGISKSYIDSFMRYHKPRIDKYIIELEAICNSDEALEKKKKQIIEKLIVVMYQTLSDIQKLQVENVVS